MTSPIKFGTDGWRGVIADDFTFSNVRLCAQGLANHLADQAAPTVVIGYDTRFASEDFAAAVAEVMAGNGLRVVLCDRATPTPVVSYYVAVLDAAAGVAITASHNPARWNGFKVRVAGGGSAPDDVAAALERRIAELAPGAVRSISLDQARREGLVQSLDPCPRYYEQVARLVDLDLLKRAGLTVVNDAMHGAGAGYLAEMLAGGATRVIELRSQRNPAFPGMHNPEPVERNLGSLREAVVKAGASVGLAFDGDADRLGVVDESGGFVTPNHVFALLALYLLEVKGQRGTLVKTQTVSSMLFRLGQLYGVPVVETPVGFKHMAPLIARGEALIGGEESGGLGVRGHIPERDGVLSGLMFLEMMVTLRQSPSELVSYLFSKVGPHFYRRLDVPFPPERRSEILRKVSAVRPGELAGGHVVRQDRLDGFRFVLEDESWLVVRFSGTEPLLRIYAEAHSEGRVEALLAAGKALAGVEVSVLRDSS
ncbi:MAG: phosphoglucomutase/phosphomannomutase family protein [Chloroflexi bacterium]|nr:phosphoglucomutase/phosphomannomutase family protein [Chloroflexota bacterium]